jgi:hypothetical protein
VFADRLPRASFEIAHGAVSVTLPGTHRTYYCATHATGTLEPVGGARTVAIGRLEVQR